MQTTELITTTTGWFAQWVDTPTTVALVFALAGAVYLGIYILRRIRRQAPVKGMSLD